MTTFVADLFHPSSGVNPMTVSFNAGAANYLRVYVIAEGGVSVSSVAFGAQTPTLISSSASGDILGVYQLVNPSAGSQTVTVTLSGVSGRCAFYIVSRSGVNTSTPSGTPGTNSGSGTAVSATASSAVGELVEGVCHVAQIAVTSGGGQTERENQADWETVGRSFSAAEEAGAASVTLDWTITTADWFAVAIPIRAAAGASSILKQMLMNH